MYLVQVNIQSLLRSVRMGDIFTQNIKTVVLETLGRCWEDVKLRKTKCLVLGAMMSQPIKTFLPKEDIVYLAL